MFTREELVFIDNVMNTGSDFKNRQVIKDKIDAVLPLYK